MTARATGSRRGPRAARLAARGAALALACAGLLVACAEPPAEKTDAAAEAAQTAAAPSAPAATGGALPPEQADGDAPAPAAFEAAGPVRADPALSADARPAGDATARWGRGPEVDAKSPWRSVRYDGIHDTESDAASMLQQPGTAFRSLPRARSGNLVDWAEAINSGAIKPRARAGSQGAMEVLDLDVLRTNTKNMPYVVFPHKTHTEWLGCSNCHDWLFEKRAGATPITMTDIARGRSCGMCHGKVAFPPTDCFRCHSGPRPQSGG